MNLNFPTRFLKKLEIYQQIRSGQGISKHKHLWKYEAAFLQYCYGKGHQHLSNFFKTEDVMKNIGKIEQDYPKNERHHILTNLFWRGYVDAVFVEEVNENGKRKVTSEKLIDRNSKAFTSDTIKDKKQSEKYFFQPTIEGLLIGEVLTEIHNKNPLLKFWNNYKYDFILDALWLIAALLLAKFIFGDEFIGNLINQFKINWKNISFDNKKSRLIFILALPLILRFCRKIYACLESQND